MLSSVEATRSRYRGFGKERLGWYLKNGARAAYKELVNAARHRPAIEGRPVVILFSQRSGSTWLLELLRSLDGLTTFQDPVLERNSFHYARFFGFPQRHYYYEREDLEAALPYLRQVLELRRVASLDLDGVPRERNARARAVVKVSNAPWTDAFWRTHFDAQVFRLMRHPVLAARSQMRFFRMPMHLACSLDAPTVRARLDKAQLAICQGALASGDEMRIRLCEIFLENLPAFGPNPEPTPQIHYEHLLARKFDALEFASAIDPDWRARFEARFDRPSRSSTDGKVVGNVRGVDLSADEAAFFGECVAVFRAEAFMPVWTGTDDAVDGRAP